MKVYIFVCAAIFVLGCGVETGDEEGDTTTKYINNGVGGDTDDYSQARTSIQIVELIYETGVLSCNRNATTYIRLQP